MPFDTLFTVDLMRVDLITMLVDAADRIQQFSVAATKQQIGFQHLHTARPVYLKLWEPGVRCHNSEPAFQRHIQ